MEITKGKKAEKDENSMLNKTIYGLVQRAREIHKTLCLLLKDVDLKFVLLISVFVSSIVI
jgi:hypothetical protein